MTELYFAVGASVELNELGQVGKLLATVQVQVIAAVLYFDMRHIIVSSGVQGERTVNGIRTGDLIVQ